MELVKGRKKVAEVGFEECFRFPASDEPSEVSCPDGEEGRDVERRGGTTPGRERPIRMVRIAS